MTGNVRLLFRMQRVKQHEQQGIVQKEYYFYRTVPYNKRCGYGTILTEFQETIRNDQGSGSSKFLFTNLYKEYMIKACKLGG